MLRLLPLRIMSDVIISVRDLSVRYRTRDAVVHAVERVSFDLERGKILALVGESGSGKSTAAMSILRLLPPDADILSGEVWFEGQRLPPQGPCRDGRARRANPLGAPRPAPL